MSTFISNFEIDTMSIKFVNADDNTVNFSAYHNVCGSVYYMSSDLGEFTTNMRTVIQAYMSEGFKNDDIDDNAFKASCSAFFVKMRDFCDRPENACALIVNSAGGAAFGIQETGKVLLEISSKRLAEVLKEKGKAGFVNEILRTICDYSLRTFISEGKYYFINNATFRAILTQYAENGTTTEEGTTTTGNGAGAETTDTDTKEEEKSSAFTHSPKLRKLNIEFTNTKTGAVEFSVSQEVVGACFNTARNQVSFHSMLRDCVDKASNHYDNVTFDADEFHNICREAWKALNENMRKSAHMNNFSWCESAFVFRDYAKNEIYRYDVGQLKADLKDNGTELPDFRDFILDVFSAYFHSRAEGDAYLVKNLGLDDFDRDAVRKELRKGYNYLRFGDTDTTDTEKKEEKPTPKYIVSPERYRNAHKLDKSAIVFFYFEDGNAVICGKDVNVYNDMFELPEDEDSTPLVFSAEKAEEIITRLGVRHRNVVKDENNGDTQTLISWEDVKQRAFSAVDDVVSLLEFVRANAELEIEDVLNLIDSCITIGNGLEVSDDMRNEICMVAQDWAEENRVYSDDVTTFLTGDMCRNFYRNLALNLFRDIRKDMLTEKE